MSETKVTPFRFTDDELEVLGLIEGQTGIRSRTEALRAVLREHAPQVTPEVTPEVAPEAPASGSGSKPGEPEGPSTEKARG